MGAHALAVAFSLAAMGGPAAGADGLEVTHGPILGRLGPHQVGVWARTSRPGTFHVRYGPAPDRMDQLSPPAFTSLAHDNTGWVLITGLKADTRYYYRLVAEGRELTGPERGGSFRTLPDSAALRDRELNPRGLFNFRFEFGCGNNQNEGHSIGPTLPAFGTMLRQLKDRIQFAILNGDWLYERERQYGAEQWARQAGAKGQVPKVVQVAPTICGVWQNYKSFLDRAENLRAWHRQVPSFFTFDDHEILNDVWGAGQAGLRDRRAVFRDIGVRAWFDYLGWSNPVPHRQAIYFGLAELSAGSDVLTDRSADFRLLDLEQAANLHIHWGGPTAGVNDNRLDGIGGAANAGVYELVEVLDRHRLRIRPPARADGHQVAYSVGRRCYYRLRIANCDFYMLDTRSHRHMHDVRHPDKPGLSMLGAQQKKWLIDNMKRSDADFFFIVSSVNFMVPHVGGGAVRATNKDDAWTVFLEEREQLIRFWDSLRRPVMVLTGDLHNSFVVRITDRVWEFASGPHNSNNHWYTDEGRRPASGPFQYGPRPCFIRWSTWFRDDIPRRHLQHPTYCVVQVNNVFNNPLRPGGRPRWVAFPRPQVVFGYYDGRTGELRYAEAIVAEGGRTD